MNDTRHMRAGTGNRIALGVLILIVALFAFISTAGGFGGVGEMVSDVLVGFFGLADYAYSLAAVVVAVAVIFNFRVRMAPSRILKLSVLVLLGIWALHIYSSSGHLPDHNYGEYLTACYRGSNTAGGMLFGILSFPLMRALTTVGALVVVLGVYNGLTTDMRDKILGANAHGIVMQPRFPRLPARPPTCVISWNARS